MLAVVLFAREHLWLRSAQIGHGRVIELVASRGSKGRKVFAPRIRYRAGDGSEHEFTRNFRSSPAGFVRGERVMVAYDPRTYEGRILTFGQPFGVAAIIASVGLAIVCMAVFFIAGQRLVPRIYQGHATMPILEDGNG